MVDLALMQDTPYRLSSARLQSSHRWDRIFRRVTLASAVVILAMFGGIIWTLISGAWLSIRAFGVSFLWTQIWNPVTEKFGALAPIYGTLVTSLIAMIISVPVGIGIAIFLTELCPRPLQRPIGIAVELLAGIPSIIYGIWGFFIFAPWFLEHVQQPIVNAMGDNVTLNFLLGNTAFGIGIFTAGLILSIMILPFISAVTRDVLETVPSVLKEASYGLGSTSWEVMWKVCLPY